MKEPQNANPYYSGRVYRIVWNISGLLLAVLGIYVVFFGVVDLPIRIGSGLLITLFGINAVWQFGRNKMPDKAHQNIQEGGVFGPIHNPIDRPGTVYILQGTITDHRNGVAKDYGPGVGWPENRGATPAIEISVDIVKHP